MIYYSSLDAEFPYKQCEDLYAVNRKYVQPDGIEFGDLLKKLNGHFWAVCDLQTKKLMGCIYFEFRSDEKWYLSGFSQRKMKDFVSSAIDFLVDDYKLKEVYSETTKKHAIYALLRSGFEKIGYNIYIRRT